MKVNWKDFALMFIIGVALVIFIDSLFKLFRFGIFYWESILLLSFGIPMIFFFYRNRSDLKEAAVIAFAFGFVANILFAFTLIVLIFYPITITPDQYAAGYAFLFPDPTRLLVALAIPSLIYAVLSLAYGLMIWFVIDKLKWRKVLEKPKESKK